MKYFSFVLLLFVSWSSQAKDEAIRELDIKIENKYTDSGCCSWHGGVCGCNKLTNMKKCCDGTDSPHVVVIDLTSNLLYISR